MRARFRIRIPALALVLSVSSYAQAQSGAEPTPAQVRVAAEAFDKGREAYKSEDYVEAAEQFEKADDNAPSPAAIELAIRARDKAGELDRAATLLALALKRSPDDANLGKIAADMSKRWSGTLFELTANCDQPCDLTVGGKIAHGPPDTQRIIYVQPGKITVRAGWADNRSESKTLEGEAGGKGELSFSAPSTPAADSMTKEPTEAKPEPPPVEQDAAPKKSGGIPRGVFFGGLGLTAVLGGVTVWSGIDTVNNPGKDKVKAACESGAPDCNQLYEQGRSNQTRTNILIGATSLVAAGTIVVGIFTNWGGSDKSSSEKSAHLERRSLFVAPWASPSGGGVAAAGRF
jgi:hypothetical protein